MKLEYTVDVCSVGYVHCRCTYSWLRLKLVYTAGSKNFGLNISVSILTYHIKIQLHTTLGCLGHQIGFNESDTNNLNVAKKNNSVKIKRRSDVTTRTVRQCQMPILLVLVLELVIVLLLCYKLLDLVPLESWSTMGWRCFVGNMINE